MKCFTIEVQLTVSARNYCKAKKLQDNCNSASEYSGEDYLRYWAQTVKVNILKFMKHPNSIKMGDCNHFSSWCAECLPCQNDVVLLILIVKDEVLWKKKNQANNKKYSQFNWKWRLEIKELGQILHKAVYFLAGAEYSWLPLQPLSFWGAHILV